MVNAVGHFPGDQAPGHRSNPKTATALSPP